MGSGSSNNSLKICGDLLKEVLARRLSGYELAVEMTGTE